MSHRDRGFRRRTSVDHAHLPHVVELERPDAVADEETEDLGHEMERRDGEGVGGEDASGGLVGGGVVELPFLVV